MTAKEQGELFIKPMFLPGRLFLRLFIFSLLFAQLMYLSNDKKVHYSLVFTKKVSKM